MPVHIDGGSDNDSPPDIPPSPPAAQDNAATATASMDNTTDQPAYTSTHRGAHKAARRMHSLPQWHPQTDIFENDTHIIVAADVPGMSIDDFDLRIVDQHLVILGQKPGSIREQFAYRRGEKPTFGTLAIKVRLPPNIHLQGDASYDDGILQVRFPKRRQRPRPVWHERRPRRRRNFWDPFGGDPHSFF